MKIAIIGGGPAGFMAAITAKKQNPSLDITIFEKHKPLATILPTGGGRCNLAHAEFDFKELASNFPRGEKFLYSVFSQFDTSNTFEFFEKLGVELYIQEDNRIFPASDKASQIRNSMTSKAKALGINIRSPFEIESVKKDGKFIINDKHHFDKIVIATGGKIKARNNGFELAKSLGHSISELAPSLYGMKTKQNWCSNLAGISLKNIKSSIQKQEIVGDLLFTHNGVSGPLILKISSYFAYKKKPLTLAINLTGDSFDEVDKSLIEKLALKPKKNISNLLSEYATPSLVEVLLKEHQISADIKSYEVNSQQRKSIANFLTNLEIQLIDIDKTPMVTAGGVNLDEVDSKTMESKKVKGLYFCGEVLNIDGLTGGFNLQSCWSTGYIVGTKL